MPRSIWKGAIAFGLVYVPVALYPASQEDDVDFDWLDKRSMDPVGYQRINKRTGKTITKENIVKGVKQDDGRYVVVDDDEIRAAYPKTTQTIEIESFVKAGEISFVYLEKPYYLEPARKAEKVYALLRDAMIEAGVVGIARIVMHNKEHLAALMPAGPALMLDTLRWATEIRAPDGLSLPTAGKGAAGPREGELKLARQLIGQLTGPWKPGQFHDHFADEIRRLVAAKAAAGKKFEVTPMEHVEEGGAPPSNVVDLTELLRSSLGARRGAAGSRSRTSGPANGPGAPGEVEGKRESKSRGKATSESKGSAPRPALRKTPAARTKTGVHRVTSVNSATAAKRATGANRTTAANASTRAGPARKRA